MKTFVDFGIVTNSDGVSYDTIEEALQAYNDQIEIARHEHKYYNSPYEWISLKVDEWVQYEPGDKLYDPDDEQDNLECTHSITIKSDLI